MKLQYIFYTLLINFEISISNLNEKILERHITIVTASYNNKKYYQKNLDSIFNQNYSNYDLFYIDDGSNDGTAMLVENYIKNKSPKCKITLKKNKKSLRSPLHNQYKAIHNIDPNSIVVILDGDDWFAHNNVLKKINETYSNEDVWMTYGQFKEYPSNKIGFCCPMPKAIIEKNNYRNFRHQPSHLRSYYAWLFQKIKLKDLLYDGRFFPMTGDLAASMPMIEMTGGKFKFIPEILYIYNTENPLNDHKIDIKFQHELSPEIRKRARYKPLLHANINTKRDLKNLSADMVIYSYNRPLQLEALLESIKKYVSGLNTTTIIYRSEEERFNNAYKQLSNKFRDFNFVKQDKNNFKELVIKYAFKTSSQYIIFGVDDIIVKDYIELNKCIQALEETDAYGFFLRLGKNITYSYMCNTKLEAPKGVKLGKKIGNCKFDQTIYAWQFKYGRADWGYCNCNDMTLYNKNKIVNSLQKINFNSPNYEEPWSFLINEFKEEVGLCFENSKIINIPLNLVQTELPNNKHMNLYSVQELLQMFQNGWRIDIDKFYKFNNNSPHEDVKPNFIRR